MHPYAKLLHDFLPPSPHYGDADVNSMLEFLWRSYTDINPIDNAKIKSLFLDLEVFSKRLSIEEADQIFDITSHICIEHERLAFIEGMRVGVLLMDELKTFDR